MNTPSLTTLLLRWEDEYRQGRDLAAEELCPGAPELAAELQQAIDVFKRMNRLLGVGRGVDGLRRTGRRGEGQEVAVK